MENKMFISHYQTTADETIGQNIELIQYSTSYVILPFIYTLYLHSYHRNSSYSCRVDGCVRHLTLGHSWRGTGRTSTALQRRVLTADTWCPRVDHTWLGTTWKGFIGFITMSSQTLSGNHQLCLLLPCLPSFLHLCHPMCLQCRHLFLPLTMAPGRSWHPCDPKSWHLPGACRNYHQGP